MSPEIGNSSRFRDVDGDGVSDLINSAQDGSGVHLWSHKDQDWRRAEFSMPIAANRNDPYGAGRGIRFVDIDGDGDEDLIFSDATSYEVRLFEDDRSGWSRVLINGKTTPEGPVPPILLHGGNSGVWFRRGEMLQVNEFTANQKDHLVVRKFSDWMK
ncbi:MAG: hypothetical protein ACI9VS_003920 [Candidatus Binatia bacterium]